jgi:hypothetical protein
MSEIPYEYCRRYRSKALAENCYLTISDTAIMAHFSAEGGYENKDMKALLNFCCRLASKHRAAGSMTWADIALHATRSGVGHRSITDDIARAIIDFAGEVK